MPNRYLVIGGTGRTGSIAVERLREEGATVRILSRHSNGAYTVSEIVHGSITDAEAVRRATQGVDGVIVVVESVETDDGPNSPEQVHFQGMQHVIAAAREQKPHIVLVSQIYITRPERYPAVRNVIRWRGEAEQALRLSGLPYTIVRPSWLTDAPGKRLGVRLEQGDRGEGEVARADIAEACVQALLHPSARGKTFEMYNVPGESQPAWDQLFQHLRADSDDRNLDVFGSRT